MDDISYLDPETINGLNLYAYWGNNSVMNVDPNGNAWWNPFSWKKEILMKIESVFAVVGSAVLMATGVGAVAGMALIGAGVGSIAGVYIAEAYGYSFNTGWAIGALAGAAIGAGIAYIAPHIASFAASSWSVSIPKIGITNGVLAFTKAFEFTVRGSQILTGAGILGGLMLFADRRMGPNGHSNNRAENKYIDYLQKKYDFTDKVRRMVHDEITGKGYSNKVVEEIIKAMLGIK